MSDAVISDERKDSGVSQPESALTAGAMLRRAREAAGLHVAALAVSMKVPVKKLEALEADRLDQSMDAVFVRALASSMCRALKIDPAPVLERLPQSDLPKLQSIEQGINAPFHVPGQRSDLSIPAFLAKPGVLVVVALLLGALILFFFPDIHTQDVSVDLDRSAVSAPATPAQDIVTPLPAEMPAAAPEAVASAPVSQTNDLTPMLVTNPPAVVPAVTAPVVAPNVDLKPIVPVAVPESTGVVAKVVRIKSKGTTWVEVVDGKGVVQVRKTLVAGDVVEAGGSAPLAVVVGRADFVEVEVRGKPFSPPNISKDNVARFEVK